MRKNTAFVLAIMIILMVCSSIFSICASAFGEELMLKYRDNGDGTVTVYGYIGDGVDVVIPETCEGKPTTRIAGIIFADTDVAIETVSLPSSIIEIEESAFSGIQSLHEINVNDECENYKSFDGVLYEVDKGLNRLKLVTYPAGKTDTKFIIPDNVSALNDVAFLDAKNLTEIAVGKNLRNIGIRVFAGCDNLETISSSGNGFETYDGVLYNSAKKLIYYPVARSGEKYVIDNDVTGIEQYAFENSKNLKEIVVGSSVAKIESYTFYRCEKLEKVEFNGYVESIENNAFEQCANLKELYFNGDAPTNVGNEIFGSFRNVTIFYNKNASGWETPIWNGYNTQPVQGEDVFFTVNFYGFDNELLSTQKVKQGENAVVDFVIPEVQGYEFVGWTELLENVQSDMNIYAVYQKIEPKSYTVTFIDWDETVLKVEEVQVGKSATAPANPIREGYTFIGWDKDFSKVTYNMFVYAQYELIQEPTPTPIDEVIKGDVDNNGSVEAADATAVLRHVAQLTVIEGNSALAADVDGNGVIEAADATMILRFVAQLITSF